MAEYKTEYRNIMESLVEMEYESIKDSLDCCTCPVCHNDIVAYALNLLPTKYVATRTGEVYSKSYILRIQHRADITSALVKAAAVIKENPRH